MVNMQMFCSSPDLTTPHGGAPFQGWRKGGVCFGLLFEGRFLVGWRHSRDLEWASFSCLVPCGYARSLRLVQADIQCMFHKYDRCDQRDDVMYMRVTWLYCLGITDLGLFAGITTRVGLDHWLSPAPEAWLQPRVWHFEVVFVL